MGCGAIMLGAIIAMYSITDSIIGTAVVAATVGVRQGSPTSCLLFVVFVNDLIKLMKENCGTDGFLSWLHLLVLMDDTVLLSTSRNGMRMKLELLNQYCKEYGMKVNMQKTKFFAINCQICDRQDFIIEDLKVSWCDQYVYLGSIFTSDGSVSSSIAAHAQSKICHLLKFVSFVNKNNDLPFYIKRKVFDAALMSSILYGSESWLNGNIKPVLRLYNWGIKQLLGVRMSTCNELCYVELGYPTLKALITNRQRKFFGKMWNERREMLDDPWSYAIRLMQSSGTPTSRYLQDLIENDRDDITESLHSLKTAIGQSTSSRRSMYKILNPDFKIHNVYTERKCINDIERISFSRLRVGGHSLAVETGRWNRRGRGRLPLEERLCDCGEVQTECHVIEACPVTLDIRRRFNYASVQELMCLNDGAHAASAVHQILSCYG
ncbi:hypothetical protein SNEBB_005021 [Seison nebaliae]|nr:hypothetical protein SNEBB_005021 [Seison nebaliae]